MTAKISIIIPTYNHSKFVCQAVESALAQTLPAYEIIVVDDGSTDETTEVLAKYKTQICYVKQENQGVSAARNNGVNTASGDFVAFLDADDIWFPQKLEWQIKKFTEEKELGLVHCGYIDIDENGDFLQEHIDGMAGWVAEEMLFFKRPVILGGGSGSFIPKKVFQEVGGFDLRLSTSADWDLYFRIAQKWQIGFVPKILLKYRLHSSNMHGNIKTMQDDMLLAYYKAFNNKDNIALQKIRRYAYSRLHSVLAGSFYTVGQYKEIFPHLLQSIALHPQNLFDFVKFPVRLVRKVFYKK